MTKTRLPFTQVHASTLILLVVLALAGAVYYAAGHGILEILAAVVAGALLTVLMVSDLRFAVIVAVFSIPFESFFVISGTGTITKFLLLGVAASYLFHLASGRMRPRWKALSPVGWLWLVWAAASLFWSTSPQVGLFIPLVQMVLFAFLIAAIVAERPRLLPAILWTYVFSASIIAAAGVIRFLLEDPTRRPTRISAGEAQGVEHFAAYLLPALVFLVVYALRSRQHWLKALGMYVLSTVLVFGLLMSGTRSAWLGAVAALIIVVVPNLRPRQLAALVTLVVMLGLGASLVPGVTKFVDERASQAAETGGAGRVDIWKVGAGIVSEAPLMGVGFSNFPMHFGVQEIRAAPFGLQHRHFEARFATHSIYLGNLAELGLVGLTLLIAWFLPLLFSIKGNDVAIVAVRGAFVAYLIQGMFLDILSRKYFWLVLGLAEGCRLIMARRENVRSDDAIERTVDHEQLPQHG